jgi:hypothetical protein
MAHAHCKLGTSGYEYRVRICNTYCFSNATVVARTHLSVKLYFYCLLCVIIIFWKVGVPVEQGDKHKILE